MLRMVPRSLHPTAVLAFVGYAAIVLLTPLRALAQESGLPGADPLLNQGDFSAQMVAGIDRFLMQEIDHARMNRSQFWNRDAQTRAGYNSSVRPNRDRLLK